MKILFPVGSFYPSTVGGPSEMLYWHTCALVERGIDVRIITTTEGIEKGHVETNKFYYSSCGQIYYGSGKKLHFKTINFAFSQIKKVDIVHLTSLFSPISIVCFLYIKLIKPNVKIIWSVRGELSEHALKYSRYRKKVILYFYKKMLSLVVFASTSEKETSEIKKIFNKTKIIEIPNLINPPQRLADIELKKQFLFVGRIHPIKNLDKLIEAFSISNDFLNSDFYLVILGDYEQRYLTYYEYLLDLVEKNGLYKKIEFRGYVSGMEKEKLFAESYFTFLPSQTENFGNVVIESLNQATPVVASKKTPWEILKKAECGFWIDNTSDEIAKIIDHIICLPQQDYLQYRKKSVQLVDKYFNINNRIQEWIEVYNNLEKKPKTCGN